MLRDELASYGPPHMIICDGGKEFQGRFNRGCESLAILQHVTAVAERPAIDMVAGSRSVWTER